MTFEIGSGGVDVREVMREIRRRIEEKKRGLYTEEELREIGERPLHPVLDAHDFRSGLLEELLGSPERWNYSFDPETVYRSSRGLVGRVLESLRGVLKPIQKLFWNPNPMIAALSRQSDLNTCFVHLLHNMALEMTRLNLEIEDLRNRVLQLQGRLELHSRREKTLESLVAEQIEARREGEGGSRDPR
jgi:predicted Holliday junction resolvase-like endonuclease